MFTKTLFALITALVLTASFVPAQACVGGALEEGAASAYPAGCNHR